MAMESKEDYELLEPVSPTAQCFNSSFMSVSVIAVLETEIPIDVSKAFSLVKDLLLPLNPMFSSIMVEDINGKGKWKEVEVNPQEHIFVPTFPSNLSVELYDAYFDEYMTNLAIQELPQTRPLWEVHLFKYPTSNAVGNIILKFHHSLGDGYSLMSLLFSCLKRADDPSLPLTFPWRKFSKQSTHILCRVPQFLFSALNSALDFGWSIVKSSVLEDDLTPIRSGGGGVKFRPMAIWTITFSLHHFKQIKSKLRVSINDVVTGMIFLGIRLYMQEIRPDSTKSDSTALVMLNTRMFGNYKSVQEMLKPDSDAPWGNRISFLQIDIPKVSDPAEFSDPLQFINGAHKMIKKKRNSSAVFLVAKLLEMVHKFRGPQEAAKYVYNTMKNSSIQISNMIGPKEKMALSDYPAKGIYFTLAGAPQSLIITIVSYMENLRMAFGSEKEFVDEEKLKWCMKKALKMIHKASMDEDVTI